MSTAGQVTNLSILQATAGVLGGVTEKRQADEEATTLRKIGKVEAERTRVIARKLGGAQINAFRGNPAIGTILDIQAEAAAVGELDALRTRFGFRSRASQREGAGRQAIVQAGVNAASTILGAEFVRLSQNAKPLSGGPRAPLLPGTI